MLLEPSRPPPGLLSSFIGRVRELADLAALVEQFRLVTLVGPGGCGKTRLALRYVEQVAIDLGCEWAFVDLAPVSDRATVSDIVHEALGARQDVAATSVDQVVDRLSGRRVLVVIDNCEHVVEQVASVIDTLLVRLEALTVVATSREPLGGPGEAVFRVPPMTVPGAGDDRERILATDAARLLLERAAAAGARKPMTADELDAVALICRRLDGLPLAIELAAARLTLLAPAAIAKGLDDRFRLLTAGNRLARSRHQTLLACVEWSYLLLGPHEQRLLDLLSVFRGRFTLDAVAAVLGGPDAVEASDVFDALDQLVRKSLVVADTTSVPTRFHLLETIAAFAADRLVARGQTDEARRRHLAFFRDLVATGRGPGPPTAGDPWLGTLGEDRDDVRAALEHASQQADEGRGAQALWSMVGGLTFFWLSTGQAREARHWYEACLTHDTEPEECQLPARWGAAHIAIYGGDHEFGLAAARDVQDRAAGVGDVVHTARALDTLGTALLWSDHVASTETLTEAIRLADQAADSWCLADSLQVAAYGAMYVSNFPAAGALLDRARPIAERLDHPLLLAWDAVGAAFIRMMTGALGESAAAATVAWAHLERSGDPFISAHLQMVEAWTAYLGDAGSSQVDELEQAVWECERRGAVGALPILVPAVASMLAGRGETARARAVLDAYLVPVTSFAPASSSRTWRAASLVALAEHDRARAREGVVLAADHATTWGAVAAAELGVTGALVDLLDGEVGRAEAALVTGLPILLHAELAATTIDALEILALVVGERERAPAAARLAGAARQLRDRTGILRTEHDGFTSERCMVIVEAAPAAFAEGKSAPISVTLAAVQRSRGARRRPSLGWRSVTPAEMAVVERVASGRSNKQISAELFVSPETVKTHLAHVYTKLDLANRASLTAAYLHHVAEREG